MKETTMSKSTTNSINNNNSDLATRIASIPGVSRIISAGSMTSRDSILIIFDTSGLENDSDTSATQDQVRSSLECALHGAAEIIFANSTDEIASAVKAENTTDQPRLIAIPDTALAEHGINLQNIDPDNKQTRIMVIDNRQAHAHALSLSMLLAAANLRTNPTTVGMPKPMQHSRLSRLGIGLAEIEEALYPRFNIAPLIDRPDRSYDMPWSKSHSKNKSHKPGKNRKTGKSRNGKRR